MLAAALSSCTKLPDPVSECETIILRGLKVPASYKRIDETVGLNEDGRQSVSITYDAVNPYNAPIRSLFACDYAVATGEAKEADTIADSLDSLPDDMVLNGADTTIPARPKPVTVPFTADPAAEDEAPVCDRPDSRIKRRLMKKIGVDCSCE